MRLDASRNRVLFTDENYGGNNALYAIDLATGARTTISDSTRGQGQAFGVPTNFTLEPATDPTRVLVSDQGTSSIVAVDLITGDRTQFLEPFVAASSPAFIVPASTFLDTRNSRLLGIRAGSVSNLFSAAIPGGTLQILSGIDPATPTPKGSGPLPIGCFAMDVSTTDSLAFIACSWTRSVMAVDLLSGDRVIIAL
jgi:hypothetical protein